MRVAIVHNAVPANASPDVADVLAQVNAVQEALDRLGHATCILDCDLNLQRLADDLKRGHPDVVFNLVESIAGSDSFAFAAAGLFDALGLKYTGAKTEAHVLCNNKILAKQWMLAAGLPTPPWIARADHRPDLHRSLYQWFGQTPTEDGKPVRSPRRVICKAISQHASLGIDDGAIISAETNEQIESGLSRFQSRLGHPCFGECYIAGREFNLSVLETEDGPKVLPPAEIDFSSFPPEKPQIVGYSAKWDPGAFEYQHTPRRFIRSADDESLIASLEALVRKCWNQFDLHGYARVDFRVDENEKPWILEINTNPCLSPDAGFAAALEQADMPYLDAIDQILKAAS